MLFRSPVECPGAPREDYARTYNVYPTWATKERRREIAQWSADAQETCGPSYDDGGIGALSSKIVRLWDIPESRVEEFFDFYALWYPGTYVEFAGSGEEIPPPEPPPEPPPPVGQEPAPWPVLGNNFIGLHAGFPRNETEDYVIEARPNIHKFFSAGDA